MTVPPPDSPLHFLFHHLDAIAALFTCASTPIFIVWRRIRLASALLLVGSVMWFTVAAVGSFNGRMIIGQMAASVWTFGWSLYGITATPRSSGRD